MKKIFSILLFAVLALSFTACSKVPAGNVGVKVYLLGDSKGVDNEVLGVGRYWIGMNEELYLFPTFKQNYVWTQDKTEGSPNDESITFQTSEGLSVSADIGITYSVDPEKVQTIFQKYRKGIDEITDVFLRNKVRDTFNMIASNFDVESVYGKGKTELLEQVNEKVYNDLKEEGIIIERIYLIGELRLPDSVVTALNAKVESTQRAQQRENELREAEAQAKKQIAEAEGEAESTLVKARAQAESNRLLNASLTSNLIEYEKVKKWDGVLPKANSGSTIIDLR